MTSAAEQCSIELVCERILQARREWREGNDARWSLAVSFIDMEALQQVRRKRQQEGK